MHNLGMVVLAVLAIGVALGRSSRHLGAPRPHRPIWTASTEQLELADRLAKAATHYRNGQRGRAEGLLKNPLLSWGVVADAAAQSNDVLARRIAELLREQHGASRFLRELGRANAADRETALSALIDALRGAGAPIARARVS